MTNPSLRTLTDADLIVETTRAVAEERGATVRVIELLAEIDERRLYLSAGCSSLFTFCTEVLHLSEHAAYHRIEAARASRQFPIIIDRLAEGAVTLTTVGLLRPWLTDANHRELLEAARHKSKREVEVLVAALRPKPDATSIVRRLPVVKPLRASLPSAVATTLLREPIPQDSPVASLFDTASGSAIETTPVTDAAAERYLLNITVSAETHAKLQQARALLRHTIPSGDPAAIVARALTMLVDSLERTRFAKLKSHERARVTPPGGRHIPAAVRRQVWKRDQGRCAFLGTHGRCSATEFLEFHHVLPYARGGRGEVANIELRCRAHNAHEARLVFGECSIDRSNSYSVRTEFDPGCRTPLPR